ncbi:MAG: hypothetical protein M3R04_02365 [bacterium]|nr:hypothetical protein [bacterium]
MSITAAVLICLAPVPSDGDTVRCGLSPTTVRLFGVNANETGTVGAYEAKVAFSVEAAGGLMCEPKGASYNRIVAICFNHRGEDVGRKLLEAGHVKEVCTYSRNFYGTCP